MKIINSLLLGVFVVLAMAIPAEAQWGRRYDPTTDRIIGAVTGTDGYRGSYRGYRDPYYNQYGDEKARDLYLCMSTGQNYDGIVGNFHFERKKIKIMTPEGKEKKVEVVWKHFKSCDPTNKSARTREVAAWAGLAGGGVGAVVADVKGAVIGTVAGAFVGALFGDNHGDCLPVGEPTIPSLQGTIVLPGENTGGFQPQTVSNQEQVPTTQPAISPVDPLSNITWLTVNTTDFRAVVTDPNTGEKKLIPAGGSMSLHDPSGEQPYTVVLLEPGRGKSNPVPGEIRPSQDLQGWEIVARN